MICFKYDIEKIKKQKTTTKIYTNKKEKNPVDVVKGRKKWIICGWLSAISTAWKMGFLYFDPLPDKRQWTGMTSSVAKAVE